MTKNDAVERAIKNIAELAEKAPACHPALLEGKDEQDNFMAFYKEAVTFFKDAEAVKTLQALQTSRSDADENTSVSDEFEELIQIVFEDGLLMRSGTPGGNPYDPSEKGARLIKKIRAALKSGDKGRWMPTHRHKKRGSDYQLIGPALVQTEKLLADNDEVYVYKNQLGMMFVRRCKEFNDGRFEEILPPTSEGV